MINWGGQVVREWKKTHLILPASSTHLSSSLLIRIPTRKLDPALTPVKEFICQAQPYGYAQRSIASLKNSSWINWGQQQMREWSVSKLILERGAPNPFFKP